MTPINRTLIIIVIIFCYSPKHCFRLEGKNRTMGDWGSKIVKIVGHHFWMILKTLEIAINIVNIECIYWLRFFKVEHLFSHKKSFLTWNTTRDFSSRYVLILAPMMWKCLLKSISIYLPNLDELSFRVVLALPIASMIGEDASTWNWKKKKWEWEKTSLVII